MTDLTTARLTLRKLRPGDAAAMFAYRSHPTVTRFQMWEPKDVDEVNGFIEHIAGVEADTPGTWYQLGIALRESDELIGDVGIHFPAEEPQQAEVGFTLAPAHRGRGFATEAVGKVLEYLFVDRGKHRVYARTDHDNDRSQALLKRVGMRWEGRLRESVWIKGQWVDDVIYAILDWEWRERQARAEQGE